MRAFLLLALLAAPALAQSGGGARDSADRFQLDLPPAPDTDDAVTTPESEPAAGPTPAESESAEAEPAEARSAEDAPEPLEEEPAPPVTAGTSGDTSADRLTIDTPIEALIADKRSRAVLDWNMPGLSTDKNLPKFSKLSLRRLAPLSGGRVTPELLKKVEADLAAIR